MNTVVDLMWDFVEWLTYAVLRLVEIAVVALLFWGFWVVLVKTVNAVIGGG